VVGSGVISYDNLAFHRGFWRYRRNPASERRLSHVVGPGAQTSSPSRPRRIGAASMSRASMCLTPIITCAAEVVALRPSLHEQLQSFVDDPSLGRASARAQRLPHEAIVDVDVRTHLDLNV
jgi:hypothetical protein